MITFAVSKPARTELGGRKPYPHPEPTVVARAERQDAPMGADDGVDDGEAESEAASSPLRSGPARRNGSIRPATASGSRTRPVFTTSSTATSVVSPGRHR